MHSALDARLLKGERALDLLIVGAGAAGLTAAVYAQRAGLRTLVLDKGMYGGQAAITDEIENYPGFLRISGAEFAGKLYEQALSQGAEVRFEEAVRAELTGELKRVVTDGETYEARAVILALGAKRRLLGVPGEETYTGRGVSYCATCDGAFFKGKRVAVAGGGRVALEDALYLANLCSHVTLIHRREQFTADPPLLRAARERENLTFVCPAVVKQVDGENGVVSSILIQRGEETERLTVSALFVAIGYEPDNGIAAGQVELDARGYIRAGEDCRTNLPGVFAAGDCRTKELRQIVTAAADGAVAAFQAGKFLQVR